MGGRGGSSGMRMSNKEINSSTDSIIEVMKKQPNVYGSIPQSREEAMRKEIVDMYKKGFSGLKDDQMLDFNPKNPNQYIVKEGDRAFMYKYTPRIGKRYVETSYGVVKGEKGTRIREVIMDSEKKKKAYLRQAILIRFTPRPS